MKTALSAIVLLLTLAAGEVAFRLWDGYALTSARLKPAGSRRPAAIDRIRADRRYVSSIAVASGVERSWYEEEPAPVQRLPLTEAQETRAEQYPSDPVGAFSLWNRNYLTQQLCGGATRGSLGILHDFFVFEPVESTPFPSYIHPARFSFPGYITTNSLGWRGPEVAATRSSTAIRIVFVGASTTVSSAPFSHPEYIGLWLNRWARARQLPYIFDVVNAGETGIDSSSISALVRQLIVPLSPNLVIYYEGANEFGPGATMLLKKTMPPRPNISFNPPSFAEAYSDVATRTVAAWRTFRGGDGREPAKPAFDLTWPADRSETDPDAMQSPLPMDLHRVIANLESMRTALQSANAELAVSTFIWMVYPGMRLTLPQHLTLLRYLNEMFWPVSYGHIRRMADYQNRVFESYARAKGLVLFDIARAFPRDPDLFGDAVHMTADGLRLQAWMYLQALIPLIERRIGEGRWPGPAPSAAAVDPLRSHVRLVPRNEILSRCP